MVGSQRNPQFFWEENLLGVLITMAIDVTRETGVIQQITHLLDHSKQIQIDCFDF